MKSKIFICVFFVVLFSGVVFVSQLPDSSQSLPLNSPGQKEPQQVPKESKKIIEDASRKQKQIEYAAQVVKNPRLYQAVGESEPKLLANE